MHVHFGLRIHRWVIWWFCLGVVVGVVALVNILFRDLPRTQEKLVLLFGVLHWLVGGIFCYGFGAIQIEEHKEQLEDRTVAREDGGLPARRQPKEWHSASDFLLPGNRKSLLPPRY